MVEDSSIEEKQRAVSAIERLLSAKGDLDFLRQFSTTDLQTLVVAIRGRLEN
jgi:hypothetical protein